MTTPSSPPISMENVRAELGVGYPLALNQSNVLQLAGKAGPPISLLDLLGKSNIQRNGMFIQQLYVNDDPDGNPLYAYGFNDGGGFDGPPASNVSFGSLSGNNVSTYTTNGLYSYMNNSPGSSPSDFTTYWITRLAYGAGNFNGWTLKVYSGPSDTNPIATATASYLYSVDQTQSYSFSVPNLFVPYSGQTLYVSIQP